MRSKNLHGITKMFGVLLLSLFIAAPAIGKPSKPVYKAEIRRTEGGIPHIKAKDFASLGFGTGYAAAEDNICLLAKNVLKYRGQLSRVFGPGTYNENLNSDFFYQLMIDRGIAHQEIPEEFEAMFRGYAAGYNRYLRDTGVDNISDPNCQSLEWVGEITADDVRRINTMPFWLPNFSGMFTAAVPPSSGSAAAPSDAKFFAKAPKSVRDLQTRLAAVANPYDKGSNGIALGREATKSGKGMLLANPHMTWEGINRFYAFHQTIPGVMDMIGATTLDRANVGFGTTEHVAWTNTVSPGQRYAFYVLQLGDSPTTYMFDGQPREMIAEEVTVKVLNEDGSLEDRTHTFYSTHFGFVVGGMFPWFWNNPYVPPEVNNTAFALRLADEGVRNLYGAIASYQAKSVRDLKEANDQYQHMTVYTIAADSSGEVLFGDLGPLANFTGLPPFCFQGPVMYGGTSMCQWCDDPDAAVEGILPPSQLPYLFRYDYVTNSNDSYWLTNPNEPLTGYFDPNLGIMVDYSPHLGTVGTERTPRTRSGLQMVQQLLNKNKKFTLKKLMHMALKNENYTAQLLRNDLVTLCKKNPIVELLDDEGNSTGVLVNIRKAGQVLARWDLHANLNSRGAHLFREFMREANVGNSSRTLPKTLNYTVPFDPDNPLTTPRGLDTEDNPAALQALATAVQQLSDAGIPLNARLGDLQTVTRNNEIIPIHGGPEMEGIFNKITSDPDFDSTDGIVGYPEVTGSSSSWIMATEFTKKGPNCRGILTYSLSANPESPHYADQTKMFSKKRWVKLPFNDKDVKAAALSTTVVKEGASDCYGDGWMEFGEPEFSNCEECLDYFQALQDERITEFINVEE